MTAILGISAYYHDSAAALVVDGRIVAAAQEERFSRRKHDDRFPAQAVAFCLEQAGLTPDALDYVGFYDKPLLKFERLLETYLSYAPAGYRSFREALPIWMKHKLHLPREMRRALGGSYRRRFVFPQHHESHAASAFFPSPFDEAAILTLDGVGEWATGSIGAGRGNRISILEEMHFPHSLGLLYSAFTYYCGFTVNGGEYKLMGLAPYGEPRYVETILQHLVDLKDDGSMRMDMRYFNYCQGLTMTSARFHDLFGGPPRTADDPLTQRHMDLAASIQRVTEDVVLRSARHAHRRTGARHLCLAGGVALNCVANGRLLNEGPFEQVWIQPASGDAGGSLGVALFIWHQLLDRPRQAGSDPQGASWLGPAYPAASIGSLLSGVDAPYRDFRPDGDGALCEAVATELAAGRVVGWFQDRMEFGPRALGARSLLGDPRNPDMQSTMNLKVKFRESFRPFAPAVLQDRAGDYFDMPGGADDPYMVTVAQVRVDRRRKASDGAHTGLARLAEVRSDLPAITHVDYSARVQTVDPNRHGRYHRLLRTFEKRTGCPVVVNTSFNLGWDPIVCSPRDAFETFMSSDIDALCMEDTLLLKREQPAYVAPERFDDISVWLPYLSCPSGDGGSITSGRDGTLTCNACGRSFATSGGVPQLLWPSDGQPGADPAEAVRSFYEKTPFPPYDDHESLRSLIERSRRNRYDDAINRALPFNSSILDVGCGTGQLTNVLGVSCRRVIGVDMSSSSLALAERFRREHRLSRVRFMQMNLFKPCFKPAQFDVVVCNGVLHHTGDPRGGFERLLPLVKPGGYIVVGLYNRYGRMMNTLRRQFFRMSGQDRPPYESTHTIDEVLAWFDRAGLQFVRGIPSTTGEGDIDGGLLTPSRPGTHLDHAQVQLKQMVAGNRDGGLFFMIGRIPATKAGSIPVRRTSELRAHAV